VTIANPPRGPAIDADASDTALWTRAAAGDRHAFGELFERHAEAVWNHSYRLTASWSQAEDLTSGTFLVAWRKCREVKLVRADDVAARVDGDARTAAVLAAVRTLPRAEREAVELCLLGELPAADAAELLGVAEVSVRSRLSRARALLRTTLQELS
jgi:DNA-directed RNA polymerase specialized sigma24 family protein